MAIFSRFFRWCIPANKSVEIGIPEIAGYWLRLAVHLAGTVFLLTNFHVDLLLAIRPNYSIEGAEQQIGVAQSISMVLSYHIFMKFGLLRTPWYFERKLIAERWRRLQNQNPIWKFEEGCRDLNNLFSHCSDFRAMKIRVAIFGIIYFAASSLELVFLASNDGLNFSTAMTPAMLIVLGLSNIIWSYRLPVFNPAPPILTWYNYLCRTIKTLFRQ